MIFLTENQTQGAFFSFLALEMWQVEKAEELL